MRNLLKSMRTQIRYWLFPQSKALDQGIEELEKHAKERKQLKDATKNIVSSSNPADVLSNLVIALQGKNKHHARQ